MKVISVIAAILLLTACMGKTPNTAVVLPQPLNDTGVNVCLSPDWQQEPCTPAGITGQDGAFGRDADVNLQKIGVGAAGFDFTKLDDNGDALANQAIEWQEGDADMAWHCVKDNVTGLWWEVKSSNQASPRYSANTYSWYSAAADNGQVAGAQSSGASFAGEMNNGICTGSRCDTDAYIAMANQAKLCGRADWRLPTVNELLSIADQSQANPPLDTQVFPNSSYNAHWTSQTVAFNPEFAWYVYFTAAGNDIIAKTSAAHIRLVAGGVSD